MKKDNQLPAEELEVSTRLGKYQPVIEAAWSDLKKDHIIERILAHDYTVWQPDQTEISNRLGWLDIAERMQAAIPDITSLVDQLRQTGFRKVVLIGMGGSSLAPEVFRTSFGQKKGYLDLVVLDSTDPAAILDLDRSLDLAHTIFIVSTKSGTTTETISFFKHFYNRVLGKFGEAKAGGHFIAITDPGSPLVDLAKRSNFRATVLADANLGGRYSALSHFGLLPAALVGVDLRTLLTRAINMAEACKKENSPGGWLGVILAELAKTGRDKVTFLLSRSIASFGNWIEQLIAESTGKSGKGILPVVGETPGPIDEYGTDRLFVNLCLEGDHTNDVFVTALMNAGHPVLVIKLQDVYDLGGQFYLWELATAMAGYRLGIQPFDQPNVESAKILTRKMIAEFSKKGALPAAHPSPMTKASLHEFLANPAQGAYIAIQAYLPSSPAMDEALLGLRLKLRELTHLGTTVGYGPRFLHSTGQLHKGDAGKGLFIQFLSHAIQDVLIPDVAGNPGGSLTFGALKTAQALGDQQALLEAGRKVILFNLGSVHLSHQLELFTASQ